MVKLIQVTLHTYLYKWDIYYICGSISITNLFPPYSVCLFLTYYMKIKVYILSVIHAQVCAGLNLSIPRTIIKLFDILVDL